MNILLLFEFICNIIVFILLFKWVLWSRVVVELLLILLVLCLLLIIVFLVIIIVIFLVIGLLNLIGGFINDRYLWKLICLKVLLVFFVLINLISCWWICCDVFKELIYWLFKVYWLELLLMVCILVKYIFIFLLKLFLLNGWFVVIFVLYLF